MLRFQVISQSFSVDGSGPHIGLAIVSEDAFYFVTALEPCSLMSLLTGRFMQKLRGDTGPFQTPLADLPSDVTDDPAWPVKTKDGFVCVFDRESVSKFRCSLGGNYRVTAGDHCAIVSSNIIQCFRVARILREMGWSL